MGFLLEIFKGVVLGSAAILPGISSGVLCVVFGLYEELLYRIVNFFKNIKSNFMFFLPLFIGGSIGVLLFSRIILFFIEHFNTPTFLFFMALILGSIPSLLKEANSIISCRKNPIFKVLAFLLAFSFSIYLISLETSINSFVAFQDGFFSFFIIGVFMSAGIIIPGISNTIILLIFGVYGLYLEALSIINLDILLPIGLGLLLGSFIFIRLLNFLFQNYKIYTYFMIIGFSSGSVFVLMPTLTFSIDTFIGIFLFIITLIIFPKLMK